MSNSSNIEKPPPITSKIRTLNYPVNMTKLVEYQAVVGPELLTATESFGQASKTESSCLPRQRSNERLFDENLVKSEVLPDLDVRSICADREKCALFKLWQHTLKVVENDLSLSHLELLFDTIIACIQMNKNNFITLTQVGY